MDLMLNQTCVWWDSTGPDGYGGESFDDPVELACRWEDKRELFVDASGKQRRSMAKVFLGQDAKEGDFLYLGNLDDITSADVPTGTKGAYRIQAFSKVPDLSGTEFVRVAWL